MKVKVDKTLVASIALHVLVLGWGLVSFSTKALVMPPEDSVPSDVITENDLSKIKSGSREIGRASCTCGATRMSAIPI